MPASAASDARHAVRPGPSGLAAFANQPAPAYRGRFPDDPAMTDLDNWHVFETENPLTFLNMYQFWLQKPATSG